MSYVYQEKMPYLPVWKLFNAQILDVSNLLWLDEIKYIFNCQFDMKILGN